jgi:O-antigen ligase
MVDENDFAMALNVIIPFAFFVFVGAKKYYTKIIGLLMLLTYIAGVVISSSRGGWVGLVAVLFYCIMSTKKKMGAFAAAAIAAAVVVMVAPSNYWDEVRSISNTQDRTAQSRFHYWKAAVRMYRDHPIIGIGADNGPLRMPEYYIGNVDPATRWKKTFHGTLPLVLAELGTIGIVCFLTLFFLALKYLRWVKNQASGRGDDDLFLMANSIIGGLIGFIVTATFISVAYYPQLWTLYMMAMSLVFIARERYGGGTPMPEKAHGPVNI